MVNNVPFQSSVPATPSSATIVETIDQGGGVQRQRVSIGDILAGVTIPISSGTVSLSSASTNLITPSSAININFVGIPSVSVTSGTVTLSSNPTVILSSNPTITSISSGAVSIISGANTVNVVAGSSAVTSTMSALVVAISSLSQSHLVALSSGVQISSGVVTLSSNPTVIPSSVYTVTLSSNPTVIPSSAIQVTLTSNTVALSSVATVTPSSAVTTTLSTAAGANTVTLSSVPTVTLSSAPSMAISSAIAVSSGTVTLSSNPTVIPSSNLTVTVGLPLTSGGYTISSVLLSSGTNSNSIKASAGQVYKIEAFNNSAAIAYLKLFNLASAPTAGSTNPVPVHRVLIPANTSGAGVALTYPSGDAYSTGIGYTVTGGILDTDTTALASNAFIVNIHYA